MSHSSNLFLTGYRMVQKILGAVCHKLPNISQNSRPCSCCCPLWITLSISTAKQTPSVQGLQLFILPIILYGSECWAISKADWRSGPMVPTKNPGHSLTWLCQKCQIRLCWPLCAFINYIYLLTQIIIYLPTSHHFHLSSSPIHASVHKTSYIVNLLYMLNCSKHFNYNLTTTLMHPTKNSTCYSGLFSRTACGRWGRGEVACRGVVTALQPVRPEQVMRPEWKQN